MNDILEWIRITLITTFGENGALVVVMGGFIIFVGVLFFVFILLSDYLWDKLFSRFDEDFNNAEKRLIKVENTLAPPNYPPILRIVVKVVMVGLIFLIPWLFISK